MISIHRLARLESAAASRANVAQQRADHAALAWVRRIHQDPVALRMALDLGKLADRRPDGMTYLMTDPEAAARMRAIMEQLRRSEAASAA
jgi:hypothetical protein